MLKVSRKGLVHLVAAVHIAGRLAYLVAAAHEGGFHGEEKYDAELRGAPAGLNNARGHKR